jgi:GAF domain-containing protein
MVGDRLLGVLDVESRESEYFDDVDVKVLQGLAGQVAVAIQNAQRVHGEAALLEATSPAYRASRRLTEAVSVDEVLDALVSSVAETSADGCVLGLFQPFGDQEVEAIELAKTWHRGEPPSVVASTGRPAHARVDLREDPELAKAYATRWIASDLEDMSHLPDEGRPFIDRVSELVSQAGFAPRAGANFPLVMGDQEIGFFFLYRTTPGPFSEASINLYEMLGDQAAGALGRAWLIEAAQRRADRERIVSETTARMRQSLDVETVLDTAASEIGRQLGLAALDVRLSRELLGLDTSHLSTGNGGRPQASVFGSREEE